MAADTHFAELSFLAQFQGALYDAEFTADTGQTVTAIGNAYLDDAVKVWGETSGYTNSYRFKVDQSSAFNNLSLSDVWTLDLVTIGDSGQNVHNLIAIAPVGGQKPLLLTYDVSSGQATLRFCPQGTTSGSGTNQFKVANAFAYVANTPRHFELGSDGAGNLYVFVDGVKLTATADYIYHKTMAEGMIVGQTVNASTYTAASYEHIQRVRLLPGVLRHTENFTPDYDEVVNGVVTETGTATVGIVVDVVETGSASVPLVVDVVRSGVASVPLVVDVVDPDILSGLRLASDGVDEAGVWVPQVWFSGVDVTDQVDGAIRIEAGEGEARIASFTLSPPAGTVIDLSAWTGKPVVIAIADYRSGMATSPRRLFTGKANLPTFDLSSRSVQLTCTDDLQGAVDAMTREQLAALIGGRWSSAVFDAGASPWTYAQDRLSTVPASLDLSPEGFIRVTPWAAKAVADIELDEDSIDDGSLQPDLADRAGFINQVDIAFGYRFPRTKTEAYNVNYHYLTAGFAAWVDAGNAFLYRSAVLAAIEDAGGVVHSITWEALPTTPQEVGGGFWIPNPATDPLLCLGFDAVVTFAYSQQVDETHAVTVFNQPSIDAVGLIRSTMSGSLVGEAVDLTAAETSATLYQAGITSIPPLTTAAPVAGQVNAAAIVLTDETDRAAAENALETLIDIAKIKIRAGARRTRVHASTPLDPSIDLDQTLSLSTATLAARGKVCALQHIMDGAVATTEITLAITALYGIGFAYDETSTTAPAGTEDGVTGLLTAPTCHFYGLLGEDQSFTISFPAVEASQRETAVVEIASSYEVALEEDEFSMTW